MAQTTLSDMQEMVRRREGRLGEKQQILHLISAVGQLAEAIEHEEQLPDKIGGVLYHLMALANTYGLDMEYCVPSDLIPHPTAPRRVSRDVDFRPLD